ncbi:hypothetical protein PXK56_18225 [Phaeobacter gallaeciensis]|uniref:hypothetical protein n=1 Tax=Phaeobacter gallaeciensis TaxID=60890 RepID=UPI0023809057|nr:hypothetical protein [Phaeobacter gallaeciensis]MDE4297124.1 hypothetical protein [Phaeobacter gallaeciensis]
MSGSTTGTSLARPSDALPSPQIKDLTPEQEKILEELPRQAGFYWVEDVRSNERNVAYIDYARVESIVEHWGHKMDATPGGIGVIERWLMGWTILGPVTPYKEPITYEENANYGMF